MKQRDMAARIRKLRLEAGLSLSEAAEQADLNKSSLSKIENCNISPSIATLLRIAKVLDVSITDFFVDADPEPPYVLTKKDQGVIATQDGSKFGYTYQGLALGKAKKAAEPFILTIDPNDPPGEFQHRGEEFIYMISGKMEFTICGDKLLMEPGDSIYFDSGNPHQTRILGDGPAQFLCVFIQE